jgi:hypothetical protein
MDLDLDTRGFAELREDLEDLEDDYTGGGAWTVGTAVNYSVFVEFGTRHMQAQPFVRPAVEELQARGVDGFIDDHTQTSVGEIGDIEGVVRAVAFALERRVKELAPVDTGTLRASVRAVRGLDVSKLPDERDVDASADVEVNA